MLAGEQGVVALGGVQAEQHVVAIGVIGDGDIEVHQFSCLGSEAGSVELAANRTTMARAIRLSRTRGPFLNAEGVFIRGKVDLRAKRIFLE